MSDLQKMKDLFNQLGIEFIIKKTEAYYGEKQKTFGYDGSVKSDTEGGVWTKGRHTRGKGYLGDMEKYNNLTLYDWALLRFVPEDKLKTETIDMIKDLVNQRRSLNLI